MSSTAIASRAPRILTGRMVLYYFIAFFGVVFAMNFFMVRVAISSFSGVETESAYKAGLSFKNDLAAAHAPDARPRAGGASLQDRPGGSPGAGCAPLGGGGQPATGRRCDPPRHHGPR